MSKRLQNSRLVHFPLTLAVAVACVCLALPQRAEAQAATPPAVESGQTMKDAYQEQFLIGTAADVPRGFSEQDLNMVKEHFNALTPENSFKPASVHPAEGTWNFGPTDALMEWCSANNITVHGHTLLWHAQTNPWFFEGGDKQVIIKRMQDHIATLVGRYKGKVYSWDVVNEAINDGPNPQTENLRNSQWLQSVGPEFIAIAFRAAHAADPDAILYYNDYNIENGAKHESSLHLLKRLIAEGVPVHGVGIQGHWSTTSLPYEALDKAIANYAALGLKVSITELDITVGGTSGGQLNQTGAALAQGGPAPAFTGFGRGNRAAQLNPAESARAAVEELNDEQRGKLSEISQSFVSSMIEWQITSQEVIEAARPQFGRGRVPAPADIARYNTTQYEQGILRDSILAEAEAAVAAVLTPDQAQAWLTSRLKSQVAQRLGGVGQNEAQSAKSDSIISAHVAKFAAAKDKEALFAAKAAFWKEILPTLDDAQVTTLLAPPTDLARARIPGPMAPEAQKDQADAYAKVFAILLKHEKNIERVTFWGLNDRRSWRMGENPLIFDVRNQPKAAYQAILEVKAPPKQ